MKTTCKITVKKPTLTVNKSSVTVKVGKKITLTAKATPNSKITFTTSNKKIAKVNQKGMITAIKPGKVTIRVTSNGITKKVAVNVKK